MELYIANLIMPSGFVWYLGYLFISALSSCIGINRFHMFEHELKAVADELDWGNTAMFLDVLVDGYI
jgi:hypothetical protein